jgi:hypothetical protein
VVACFAEDQTKWRLCSAAAAAASTQDSPGACLQSCHRLIVKIELKRSMYYYFGSAGTPLAIQTAVVNVIFVARAQG